MNEIWCRRENCYHECFQLTFLVQNYALKGDSTRRILIVKNYLEVFASSKNSLLQLILEQSSSSRRWKSSKLPNLHLSEQNPRNLDRFEVPHCSDGSDSTPLCIELSQIDDYFWIHEHARICLHHSITVFRWNASRFSLETCRIVHKGLWKTVNTSLLDLMSELLESECFATITSWCGFERASDSAINCSPISPTNAFEWVYSLSFDGFENYRDSEKLTTSTPKAINPVFPTSLARIL